MNFGIRILKEGFKKFAGVKRRFTKVGQFNGANIIDDYAHHPVEIKATLETAKITKTHNKSRIIAIFQPHKYSRLENLFDDFVACFKEADIIYVLDVYAAGEQPINGINSEALVSKLIENKQNAHYIKSKSEIY